MNAFLLSLATSQAWPRRGVVHFKSLLNIFIIRERILSDCQKISVSGIDKEKELGQRPGLPIKDDLKST
jgi:hypothetical protein